MSSESFPDQLQIGEKEAEQSSFEKQWVNPEKIQVGKRVIEVEDIKPEKQKTDVPMIVGLGWSETPEVNKGNIRVYVEKGRRIISPDTPHGVDALPQENYPTIELRKMTALVKTIEEKEIDKVDIVAHSEGAIFSVMAAYFYPEKFRSLVVINPAGMIGEDNVVRLGVGFSADLVGQIITEAKKEKPNEGQTAGGSLDALGGIKVLAKNPRASIESVFAMANSDLRDMLISIKEKGVKVAVVAAVDDKAFPMEKIQETLGLEHIDGFYSVKGTHNSYLLDPKPYSSLIDNALDDLEKLSKKEKST